MSVYVVVISVVVSAARSKKKKGAAGDKKQPVQATVPKTESKKLDSDVAETTEYVISAGLIGLQTQHLYTGWLRKNVPNFDVEQ